MPSALPQLPPAFVIRAIALLTHAGLVAKYFEIQNNSIACGNLLCYS